KSIILFDGTCGLCNKSVKFVLKREKSKTLFYSALQSEFGKKTLEKFDLGGETDSMVLIENGKAHTRSGAALRSTKYMRGLWPLAMVLLIVPPFIRNWV